MTLGEFGSFHAHFVLPAACPQGDYRVLVHDDAGQNYQGGFLVREYQLEPVRLAVDTPRRVYYRGEEIEGTIRATFYYGRPLAGREIRYQLADDRQYTATTDAQRRGPLQAAHARVQRNPGAPASGGAARAEPDHGGQFHAGRPRVRHRREHGPAGLPGRRDVRGRRSTPATPKASRPSRNSG